MNGASVNTTQLHHITLVNTGSTASYASSHHAYCHISPWEYPTISSARQGTRVPYSSHWNHSRLLCYLISLWLELLCFDVCLPFRMLGYLCRICLFGFVIYNLLFPPGLPPMCRRLDPDVRSTFINDGKATHRNVRSCASFISCANACFSTTSERNMDSDH